MGFAINPVRFGRDFGILAGMVHPSNQIVEFQAMIFSWWEIHKRDLPWRHTRDPYAILVSEVMLQQTQVSRVLPKYAEFMKRYPDVYALARAPTADVLRIWKGLGYNRRALYLQRAAQSVTEKYSGIFPDNEQELVKLPGMGTYTVRAVLVFAFEQDVAMVDTNIRKILTHYFHNDLPQKENVIQVTAELLVPHGKSWAWHQALMDYGAMEMVRILPRAKPRMGQRPFKETDRFIRGRIMDILREKNQTAESLIELIQHEHGRDQHTVRRILVGLEKDGLIRSSGDTIMLP